ncbi:MAG: hypothetical protein ABIM50_10510 [Novosphingobium sp.]
MTVDEYAKLAGAELRRAYNSKDRSAVDAKFQEVQTRLLANSVSQVEQRRFWALVEAEFFSSQLLLEKQEGSALHRLMQDIEARLEARKRGDTG